MPVGSRPVLAIAAAVLAIGAIVGTVLVFGEAEPRDEPAAEEPTGAPEEPARDAEEVIAELYEEGDPVQVLNRSVPGTVDEDPNLQLRTLEILELVLREPFVIAEREVVTVHGVEIARLRVGNVNWCVLPDERLLLGCRVARVTAMSRTTLPDVSVAHAAVNVFPTRVDVAAVVESQTSDDRYELPGLPEFDSELVDSAELVAVDHVIDNTRVPAPPRDLGIREESGMLFEFEAQDVEEIERIEGAVFYMVWSTGQVEIVVREVEWLVP
jgi:hypothetical protein